MKKIMIDNKNKLIILVSLLSILIISYLLLILYNYNYLKKYNEIIYPNTYVGDVDLSGYSYSNSRDKLEFYSDYILSLEIVLKVNDKEYKYKLKDMGISIDYDKTIRQIIDYQDSLGYSEKLMSSNGRVNKVFDCIYVVDNDKLSTVINSIKSEVDVSSIDGYFDTNDGVVYHRGVAGFSLNTMKSVSEVDKVVEKGINKNTSIELVGDVVGANENEEYSKIDTMTSSFVTVFTPNTYMRNINLNTALGYINGSVVNPGEVFSYCDKAGPFDKRGYVFYYEFVGNGVCQIATTTYNAALLGGLEIVKRYPHDKKSAYVEGGLDATVASYSSGWCVDMQFRNTYKYPIYIKAYSEGGRAHVEFWSNSEAKEGREYTTESVWLGGRGYESYLHTFKDGQEISRDKIATTWYTKD